MPETSAAGLTASPVRLPWVVMRKTPTSASKIEQTSNTRGRALLDADDQQDDDGETSCKIVPMPALDSWIVRK